MIRGRHQRLCENISKWKKETRRDREQKGRAKERRLEGERQSRKERGVPGDFSEGDLHDELAVVHGLLVDGLEGLLLVIGVVELNESESLAVKRTLTLRERRKVKRGGGRR